MLTPLIVGILFGVETLSGVLVSGVQLIAISASNTDSANKYIEAWSMQGRLLGQRVLTLTRQP
ncbi:unnamed protein product [Rhodiola kirilowii]